MYLNIIGEKIQNLLKLIQTWQASRPPSGKPAHNWLFGCTLGIGHLSGAINGI